MNPYEPPSTTTHIAPVSLVSIGILTVSTIGLCLISAVLCGISCYTEINGRTEDDFMAILISFGVPSITLVCIGIPAGMIHLRRRSVLGPIPIAAYIVALTALVALSFWGSPINRWFSISLVCYILANVVSIRTAVRYQLAFGG